jgi:hypothetical protein
MIRKGLWGVQLQVRISVMGYNRIHDLENIGSAAPSDKRRSKRRPELSLHLRRSPFRQRQLTRVKEHLAIEFLTQDGAEIEHACSMLKPSSSSTVMSSMSC